MRASSSLLALLAASVAPLIQASTFEFTGPDTNAPLNLSASSINITWTLDRGDNPGDWKARHINLNYISETSDGTGISYAIGTNISLPDGDGSYSWNPASVLEGLNKSENGNLWVSSGKKHYFTASTEPAGTTSTSDKYSVEGYDRIGSSAAGLGWSMRWVAVGLLTVAATNAL